MGLRFTKEEFSAMANELLYSTPVSFDMLCRIAEKTLRPSVVNWCNGEDCLRGRGYEDDIMQEIHLRLMKTTVGYFLLRDGIEQPYNNDPEGFEDWMFRVAENLKRDFANRVRSIDFKTEDIDDLDPIVSGNRTEETEARIAQLQQAFSIVLSSDVSVYKVLTWVAQFVCILDQNVPKIKSNALIIDAFEDRTLYEMYDMLLEASKKIPWIVVTEEQNEKILRALQKKRNGDVSYGETKYKSFFMKHNGEISGKKSISDWMNRMNDMLKRKTEETEQKIVGKTASPQGEGKRSSGNEAFDC